MRPPPFLRVFLCLTLILYVVAADPNTYQHDVKASLEKLSACDLSATVTIALSDCTSYGCATVGQVTKDGNNFGGEINATRTAILENGSVEREFRIRVDDCDGADLTKYKVKLTTTGMTESRSFAKESSFGATKPDSGSRYRQVVESCDLADAANAFEIDQALVVQSSSTIKCAINMKCTTSGSFIAKRNPLLPGNTSCGYSAFAVNNDVEKFEFKGCATDFQCKYDAANPFWVRTANKTCSVCFDGAGTDVVNIEFKKVEGAGLTTGLRLFKPGATSGSTRTEDRTIRVSGDDKLSPAAAAAMNGAADPADASMNFVANNTCHSAGSSTTGADNRDGCNFASMAAPAPPGADWSTQLTMTAPVIAPGSKVKARQQTVRMGACTSAACATKTFVKLEQVSSAAASNLLSADTKSLMETSNEEVSGFTVMGSCDPSNPTDCDPPLFDMTIATEMTRSECRSTKTYLFFNGKLALSTKANGYDGTKCLQYYLAAQWNSNALKANRRLLQAGGSAAAGVSVTPTPGAPAVSNATTTCGDGVIQGGSVTAHIFGSDTAPVHDCKSFSSKTVHDDVRDSREQCDVSTGDFHTACCHNHLQCRTQGAAVNQRQVIPVADINTKLYTPNANAVVPAGTQLLVPSMFVNKWKNVPNGANYTSKVLWGNRFRTNEVYESGDSLFVREYKLKSGMGACNPNDPANKFWAMATSAATGVTEKAHCCSPKGQTRGYDENIKAVTAASNDPDRFIDTVYCIPWPVINFAPNTFISNDATRMILVEQFRRWNVRPFGTRARIQDSGAPHYNTNPGANNFQTLKENNAFRSLHVSIQCHNEDQATAYPDKVYTTDSKTVHACKKCETGACATPSDVTEPAMAVNQHCQRMFQVENPCKVIKESHNGRPLFKLMKFAKGWCMSNTNRGPTCRCSWGSELTDPSSEFTVGGNTVPCTGSDGDGHMMCTLKCGGSGLTASTTPTNGAEIAWNVDVTSAGGALKMRVLHEGTSKDKIQFNDVEWGDHGAIAEAAGYPVLSSMKATLESQLAAIAAFDKERYPDAPDRREAAAGNVWSPPDKKAIDDYLDGWDLKRGFGRGMNTIMTMIDDRHSGSLILRVEAMFTGENPPPMGNKPPYYVKKKFCVHHAAPDPSYVPLTEKNYRPKLILKNNFAAAGMAHPYAQNDVHKEFLAIPNLAANDAEPFTQTSRYTVVGMDDTLKGFLPVESTPSVPRWAFATKGDYIRGDSANFGAMHYHPTKSGTGIAYNDTKFSGVNELAGRLYRQTEGKQLDEEFTWKELQEYVKGIAMIPRGRIENADPAKFGNSNFSVPYAEMRQLIANHGSYHSDTSMDPVKDTGKMIPSRVSFAYVVTEPTTCARKVMWLTRNDLTGERITLDFDVLPKFAIAGVAVRPKLLWRSGPHVIPQNKIVNLKPTLKWHNDVVDNSDMWYYAFMTIEDHSQAFNGANVNPNNGQPLLWQITGTTRRHSAGDIVGPKSWDKDSSADGACKPYSNVNRTLGANDYKTDLANTAGLYDFNFVQDPNDGNKITKRWYLFPTCAVRAMYTVPSAKTLCILDANSPRGHSNCHPTAKFEQGMSFSSYNSSNAHASLSNDVRRTENLAKARSGKFVENIAFRPHYGFVGVANLTSYVTVADFTKSTGNAAGQAKDVRKPIYAVSDTVYTTVVTMPVSEPFKITIDRAVQTKLQAGDPEYCPVTMQTEKDKGVVVQTRVKAHTSNIGNNQLPGVCVSPVEDFVPGGIMDDPFRVSDATVHGIANDAAITDWGGCHRQGNGRGVCPVGKFCTLNAYDQANMHVVRTEMKDETLQTANVANIDLPQKYPYDKFRTDYWMQLGSHSDNTATHGMKINSAYDHTTRIYNILPSVNEMYNDGRQRYWIDSNPSAFPVAADIITATAASNTSRVLRATFLNDFNTYSTDWPAIAAANAVNKSIVHTVKGSTHATKRTDVITTLVTVEVQKTLLLRSTDTKLNALIADQFAVLKNQSKISRMTHNSQKSHKLAHVVKPLYDSYGWSTSIIPADVWDASLVNVTDWTGKSGGPLSIPRWDHEWDKHHRLTTPTSVHWLLENENRARESLKPYFGGDLTVGLDKSMTNATGTRVNKQDLNQALKLDFVTLIEQGVNSNTFMDNSVDYVRFEHKTCGMDSACPASARKNVTAGTEGIKVFYAAGKTSVNTADFFASGDLGPYYATHVQWSTGFNNEHRYSGSADLKRSFPMRKPELFQVRDRLFPDESGIRNYTVNPSMRHHQLRGFVLVADTNWYKQVATEEDSKRPFHHITVCAGISDRSAYAWKASHSSTAATEECTTFVVQVQPVATAPRIALKHGANNGPNLNFQQKTTQFDSYSMIPTERYSGGLGPKDNYELMEGTFKNLGFDNISTVTNEHAVIEFIASPCSAHNNSRGIHRCYSKNFEAHKGSVPGAPHKLVDHNSIAQPFQISICIDPDPNTTLSTGARECTDDKLRMLNPLSFAKSAKEGSSWSTYLNTTSYYVKENMEENTGSNQYEGLRFVWKCETFDCKEVNSFQVSFGRGSSDLRMYARIFSMADSAFEQREQEYMNKIANDGGKWGGPQMLSLYPSGHPYTSITPNFQHRIQPKRHAVNDVITDTCTAPFSGNSNCAPGFEFEITVTPQPKMDTVQFNQTKAGGNYGGFYAGVNVMYNQDTRTLNNMFHDPLKYAQGEPGSPINLRACMVGGAVKQRTYSTNLIQQSSLRNGKWYVSGHAATVTNAYTYEEYMSYMYPYQRNWMNWTDAERKHHARHASMDVHFVATDDSDDAAKAVDQVHFVDTNTRKCKEGPPHAMKCSAQAVFDYRAMTCIKDAKYSAWERNDAYWPKSTDPSHSEAGRCNYLKYINTKGTGKYCNTVSLKLRSGTVKGMSNYPSKFQYNRKDRNFPSGVSRFTMALTTAGVTPAESVVSGYDTVTFYVASSAGDSAVGRTPVSHMYSQPLVEGAIGVDGFKVQQCTTTRHSAKAAFMDPVGSCGQAADSAAVAGGLAVFKNAYVMTKIEQNGENTMFFRGLVIGVHRGAKHYGPDMADVLNNGLKKMQFARGARQVQVIQFRIKNPSHLSDVSKIPDIVFRRSHANNDFPMLANDEATLMNTTTIKGVRDVADAALRGGLGAQSTERDFAKVGYRTCTGATIDDFCTTGFKGIAGVMVVAIDEKRSGFVSTGANAVIQARRESSDVRAISVDTLSDKSLEIDYHIAAVYGMEADANAQGSFVTVRPYADERDVFLDYDLADERKSGSLAFVSNQQMYQLNTMVMNVQGHFVEYGRTIAASSRSLKWEISSFELQGGDVRLDGLAATTTKYAQGQASDTQVGCPKTPFTLGNSGNSMCRVDVSGSLAAGTKLSSTMRYCRDISSSGDEWKYLTTKVVVSAQNPELIGAQTKALVRTECSGSNMDGVCDYSYYQCNSNVTVNPHTPKSRVKVEAPSPPPGVSVQNMNIATPSMCADSKTPCTAAGRDQCPYKDNTNTSRHVCRETEFYNKPPDMWQYNKNNRQFTDSTKWSCKAYDSANLGNKQCANLIGEKPCSTSNDCPPILQNPPTNGVVIEWAKNATGCVDVKFSPQTPLAFAPACQARGVNFVARAIHYVAYDVETGTIAEDQVMLNHKRTTVSSVRPIAQGAYKKATGMSFLPVSNSIIVTKDPSKPAQADASAAYVAGGHVREVDPTNMNAGRFRVEAAAFLNGGENEMNVVSFGKKVFKGWSNVAHVGQNIENVLKSSSTITTGTCASVYAKASRSFRDLMTSNLTKLEVPGSATSRDLFDAMVSTEHQSNRAVHFAPWHNIKQVGQDPAAADAPTFQGADPNVVRSVAAMYYKADVAINDLLQCRDGEGSPVVTVTPGADADRYEFDVCVTSFGKIGSTRHYRGFQRCRRVIMEILTSASLRAAVTTSAPLQVHVVSVTAVDATKEECLADAAHAASNLRIAPNPNVTAVMGPGYDCNDANAQPKRLRIIIMTYVNVGSLADTGVAWVRAKYPANGTARGLVGRKIFENYAADNCYGLGNRDTTSGPQDVYQYAGGATSDPAFSRGIVYTAAIPTMGNTSAFSTCMQNPDMSNNYDLKSAKITPKLKENGQLLVNGPMFDTQSSICWRVIETDSADTCRAHAFSEVSLQLTLQTTIQFGAGGAIELLGIALPLNLDLFTATTPGNGAYHIPMLAGQTNIKVPRDSNLVIQIGIKDKPDKCNRFYYSDSVDPGPGNFKRDCIDLPFDKAKCKSPFPHPTTGLPTKGSCMHSHHIQCSVDSQCDAYKSPWIPVTSLIIKDVCVVEFKEPCYDPIVNGDYAATRYVACAVTNAATHSPYVALLREHDPEVYHCHDPLQPANFREITKSYVSFITWLAEEFNRRDEGTLYYKHDPTRKCNTDPLTGSPTDSNGNKIMYKQATPSLADAFKWKQGPQIVTPYKTSSPHCLYQQGVPSESSNYEDGESKYNEEGRGLYTCKGREFHKAGVCNEDVLQRKSCASRLLEQNSRAVKCPNYLGRYDSAGRNITELNYKGDVVGTYAQPAYAGDTTAKGSYAFDFVNFPGSSFASNYDLVFELTVQMSVRDDLNGSMPARRRLLSHEAPNKGEAGRIEFEKMTMRSSYERVTGHEASVTPEGKVELKIGRNLLSDTVAPAPAEAINPKKFQTMRAPALRMVQVSTDVGTVTVNTATGCVNVTPTGECITSATVAMHNTQHNTVNIDDKGDGWSAAMVLLVVILGLCLLIIPGGAYGYWRWNTNAACQMNNITQISEKMQNVTSPPVQESTPDNGKSSSGNPLASLQRSTGHLQATAMNCRVHDARRSSVDTADVLVNNAMRVVNETLKGNHGMGHKLAHTAKVMGLTQIKDSNWKGRAEEYPDCFKTVQKASASKTSYPENSDVVTRLNPDKLLKTKNASVLWLGELFGSAVKITDKKNELDLLSGSCALDKDAAVMVHRRVPYMHNQGSARDEMTNGDVTWLDFGKASGVQQFDVRLALGTWPGAHQGLTLYAVTPRLSTPDSKNTQFVVMPSPSLLQIDAMGSMATGLPACTAPSVSSWVSLLAQPEVWSNINTRNVDPKDSALAKEVDILTSTTAPRHDHRKYLLADMLTGWVAWRPTWTNNQFSNHVHEYDSRYNGKIAARVREISHFTRPDAEEKELDSRETDALIAPLDSLAIHTSTGSKLENFRL